MADSSCPGRARRPTPSRRGLGACLRPLSVLWLLTAVTGCGAAYYEARLAETARQFAYYHKLNENLGEKWAVAGIEFRAPRQFKLDLLPRQVLDDAGHLREELAPRQPAYFPGGGVELPGLVGSWRADVDAPGGAGGPAAYLYAMSNYEMFLGDGSPAEAAQFHGLALDALCRGLDIAPPDPQDRRWAVLRVPQGAGYVPKKDLTTITLVPDATIGGAVREFRLYLYAAGEIQAAFLYVIPTGVSSRENLPERIELSFETLQIQAATPQRTPEGPAGPVTDF